MANRRQKTSRPATWSLCSCVMTMPSKLAGLIPEDSRRCAICRALNPASIRIRHCLVATREQLPPLPLPRTVKLNTPPIKAYKESEANQEMEGWKRNGRMEGWKDGRMEGWKGGRGMEGWKDGRKEGWRGGRMEGWKDGRMEGWRGGGMEGWRDGRVEGWKDGKSGAHG